MVCTFQSRKLKLQVTAVNVSLKKILSFCQNMTKVLCNNLTVSFYGNFIQIHFISHLNLNDFKYFGLCKSKSFFLFDLVFNQKYMKKKLESKHYE